MAGSRRAAVDTRVGLADVVALGVIVQAGEPLAWVHAADSGAAAAAVAAVQHAITLSDDAATAQPLIVESVG